MARTRINPPPSGTVRTEPRFAPAQTTDDRPKIVAKTKPAVDVLGRIEPTRQEVRERAYYIYLARGGVHGNPDSDWFRAERELREELRRTATARRL